MNIGKVKPTEITAEMESSYLDYAMSVIVSRALPDVRDGLKPVHRRILYSMHQMGLGPASKRTKSAKVVGETMGKYHPHGDAAIYDALVRMAQDFSLRYPLVSGQGNFGSIDGDPPAAMRYCLSGETLVITNHGLERIRDLKKGSLCLKVLSFDDQINKVTKWIDSDKHPTKTIKTYRGFSLCGTFNHPILVWEKDPKGKPGFFWKLLQDIIPGEFVVLNRSPLFFPNEPFLRDYYPQIQNKKTKKHQLPERMDKKFAFLLGALVAEGSVGKEQIGFCNADTEFLEKFKSYFEKIFPDCRLHEYKRKPQGYTKKPYTSLEIHSLYVIQFLKNLGLKPGVAKTKTVPKIIFLSSKESIASFLQGYAEGDGSVYLSGAPEISFISQSRTLMVELQLLLLRFGIDSSFRFQKSKKIYKLFIRGHENLALFQREINFVNHSKQVRLLKLCQRNKDGQVMSKTDYIPYIGEYLRNSLKYWGNLEWLKKHNLDRYPKLRKYWAKLQEILTPEDKALLESLIKRKYLFDRVVSFSESGKQRVYSLRIDNPCHSFVSNGFINHNTEVKLAPISQEMLSDLEKETVEFTDNFDATLKEPLFLPAKLPNLLMMGAEGIAVGMATKIPPHNLGEVIEAITYMIDHGKTTEEKFESNITTEELLKFIKGPDFPTRGQIYDAEEIRNIYTTGRGGIIVRGKAQIEEGKAGKFSIVINEIPYQVNKASLVAKIAQLVRDKKINGVADIRDESDQRGIRVVVELKRGGRPKAILNILYKYTDLQITFPANFVVLVDKVPQTLNLKQILIYYIRHRQAVITKRSIFELKHSQKRAHILEGLKIALRFLDAVIATIKKSKDAETAKTNLVKKFRLTEIQAQAILDMQLKRLAHLERQRLQDEYQMVKETIAYLTDLLAHPKKILKVIKNELNQLSKKYADERRTKVFPQKLTEFKKEDLVPKEEVIITTTDDGYIKRLPIGTYKIQRRGGKGVIGMTTKEKDEIAHILTASTHDEILFFTNTGRVFSQRTYELPEGSRRSKGQAIVNLIDLKEEKVTAILPISSWPVASSLSKTTSHKQPALPTGRQATSYLLMATEKGTVKKTRIADFANIRSTGIIAIRLKKGDQLCWVKPTKGDERVMLTTSQGKSICFSEKDVRPMGRTAAGVRGIRLKKGDFVVGTEVFPQELKKPRDKRRRVFQDILVVSEKGLGKRTPVALFPTQKRGGVGVKVAKVTKKTGKIVACQLVTQKDAQVVLTSRIGQVIKLPLKNISQLGRNTQGVILMRFTDPKDSVAAMTTI